MKHIHMQHRITPGEHRLIYRGEEAHHGPERLAIGPDYEKDTRLAEYAKASKDKFQKNVFQLEYRLHYTDKSDYAKKAKQYVEGPLSQWLDRFATGELKNSQDLENGLRKAEKLIAQLEQYVVENLKEGKKELIGGKTFKERKLDIYHEKSIKEGIESDVLANGTHVMDVPEDWTFTIKSGGELLKINDDPKRQYSLDISDSRKRIAFKGGKNMKVEVVLPTKHKMLVDCVAGSKPGSLKLDVPAAILTKRAEFEKKHGELLKVSKAASDAFKGIDTSSQTALDLAAAQRKEQELIEQYRPFLTQTQLDYAAGLPQIEAGADRLALRQRLRETLNDLTAGDRASADRTIREIEESFKNVYGTKPEGYAAFLQDNKEIMENPNNFYMLQMVESGSKDGRLELRVLPHNLAMRMKREKEIPEQNRHLAVGKLIDAFRVNFAKEAGKQGGDAAKQFIFSLETKSAKDEYGLYISNGDLYERDKTYFGTDEVIYKNFKKDFQNDPVKTLQKMNEINIGSIEDAKTKSAIERAQGGAREYEMTREKTLDEIEKAIRLARGKLQSIRKGIENGTTKDDAVQTAVAELNEILSKNIRNPLAIVDARDRLRPYMTDAAEKGKKAYYAFTFDTENVRINAVRHTVTTTDFGPNA